MSFKIPCGGFKLDEKSFSLDDNGVLSIPKPLTYDYMPEGYPSKSVGTVTLMEEQEVTFYETDSAMEAISPVSLAIKQGDKLTVVWDGVNYDVVVKELVTPGPGSNMVEIMFGNLALINKGESEDYPFVYYGVPAHVDEFFGTWAASDTAASHTIKVMRQQVTITPMSADFIPKNFNIAFRSETGNLPTSCNVTYDELREWVTNGIPVLAVFNTGNKVCVLGYINIGDSSIAFKENSKASAQFYYNSDGTFSGEVGPS